MNLQKINSEGTFTSFPGITVISEVQQEDTDAILWRLVHKLIAESPLLSQYYSALPVESYHMTLMDLFTQEEHGHNQWTAFIESKLKILNDLHNHLQKNVFKPELLIEEVVFDSVIQLFGSIPAWQRMSIEAAAFKFGFQDRISSDFHITLAYQYRSIPETIAEEVANELSKCLCPLIEGKRITLNSARLYHFQDMTAFSPWDAAQNPFSQPIQSFTNPYFFKSLDLKPTCELSPLSLSYKP